jgi:CheY-like chemotaxis protein
MTRVLVIDDEPSICNALRTVLESEGYEVIEASNGAIGLQLFKERRADLVLSDIYMPEMDGAEMIERFREEFPSTPVVAMSGGGWKDKGEVLDFVGGYRDVRTIEKPFTRLDILETVKEVLARQRVDAQP